MPPAEHLRYRVILIHAMDALRDCSANAERLYVRMAVGAHATRVGIITRPHDLTKEARLRVTEIDRALVELEAAGLVALSVSGAVYLVGHCANFCPKASDNRESWRDEVLRVCVGNRADILSQVIEEIGVAKASGGATAKPQPPPKERDREKEMEKETPTGSVATAPVDLFGEPEKQQKAKPKAKPDPKPLFDAFDAAGARLPKCRRTDKQIAAAIKALEKEPNVDLWRSRFAAASASDFHALEWKGADFLWCIGNPDKLDTLMHKQATGNAPSQSRNEPFYEKL